MKEDMEVGIIIVAWKEVIEINNNINNKLIIILIIILTILIIN